MMLLDSHLLQCFSFLLLLIPIALADSTPYRPKDHYLINCGSPTDGGGWRSDGGTLSPTPTSASTTTTKVAAPPPYDSGRIFWAPLTYSIPLTSPGPKLVRLYFSANISFNGVNPAQFFVSLNVNGFSLLRNFSAYMAAAHAQENENTKSLISQGRLMREFYVTVGEINKSFNLTFSSGPGGEDSSGRSYGFINGIEVISVPDGLYVPADPTDPSVNIPYLSAGNIDYASSFLFPTSMAMETMIRLNVGGSPVAPSDDTGLYRTWYSDDNFLVDFKGFRTWPQIIRNITYKRATPAYAAPEEVYGTMRTMGPYEPEVKLSKNLTWTVEVDAGFNYLVRLHFCELLLQVNQSRDIVFEIYINSQMAQHSLDVIDLIGGPQIAMYEDFVVYADDNGVDGGATNKADGSRVHLSVAMHPDNETSYTDVLLNGLEIFKLNKSDGSLAAPNPNLPMASPSPHNDENNPSNHHHLVLIIIGGTLGFILLFLVAFAFFFIYRGKDKEQESALIPSSSKPTQPQWAPLNMDEFHSSSATTSSATTSSSVASSLPSDLCQRFSLTQLRIATRDFDDSAIIGSGGFGKVYKGTIDNGATLVAIKRLNPTSTQGANEFRNEIEMLSRLRHLHLVSLIGYCEEHGEMILVYEYMPRGTLRDHLMYKSNSRADDNTPLSWKQRLMICVGSARGLHYLHSGAKQPIIHRDVKSTNILLDDKWTAKVSDFGLSKVGPASDTGVSYVSTAVKGSIGYLDPEYYRLRQLTEKSDVYSFGVVLFEVLCARQVINPSLAKDQVNLALWARSHYKSGTLSTIVDPNLAGEIAPESLRKFGEVAEMCVRDHGSDRPSMGDVVWALEFTLQLQLTADEKITGSTSGGDDGVARENEALTAAGDNLSHSSTSISGSGTTRSFTIPEAASNSDVDVGEQTMRSGSVFSEILHPQAR